MAGMQEDPDDDPGTDEEIEVPPALPWGTRAQIVAAVLWSSFLAACFATMVFFAFVDPGLLHEGPLPEIEMTRMTGYGIGFFFWLVAAISSAVSVYLVRTSHIADEDKDGPR